MQNATMTFTLTGPDPLLFGLWRELDANGFRISNLGEALDDDDAVTLGQAKRLTGSGGGSGGGGTIGISDVIGLPSVLTGKQDTSQKGQPNGYPSLDATGKVPAAQLPASGGGTVTWSSIASKPTTISGFGITDANTKSEITAFLATKANTSSLQSVLDDLNAFKLTKAQPNGLASLGSDGKVPSSQLPAAGNVDAAGVNYYPVPSIAVPVAQRLGQEVSLLDGWAPGVTDFSDLMESNLARAMSTKRPLIIPADEFFVGRQFSAANESISIYGYGRTKSVLTWATGSPSVGLEFSFNNERQCATMEDFGLWTQVKDFGRALKLDFANTVDQNNGNPVVAGRFYPKVQLRGLLIGGRGNTPNNGFRHGIDCNIANAVNIETCAFLGGIDGADPNYIGGTAIRLGAPDGTGYGHPTVAKVRSCYFQHWQAGIIFEGMEGCYAHHNDLVGVKIGIWFKDAYGRPQFNVGDNHINCSQVGVWAQGSGEHNIKGNLIYNVIGNTGTATGVLVNGNFSVGGVITGNNFANTAYNGTGALNSIVIEAGRDITIDHNVFRKNSNDPINGIWLTSGSKRVNVGEGNIYENESFGTVGYRVLDQGTENMVPGFGARYIKLNSQGSSGGLDIVTFDSYQDVAGNIPDDMTDGAYVIPANGMWCFTGGCLWADGATGVLTLNIQLNATSGAPLGSQQVRAETGNSIALSISTGPRPFRKNDVVRLGANSGGTGRTILASANTYFEARRLS